jgi:hypothetical protein
VNIQRGSVQVPEKTTRRARPGSGKTRGARRATRTVGRIKGYRFGCPMDP